MAGRNWIWVTAIVALLGVWLATNQSTSEQSKLPPPVQGRNNTVLFVTTEAPGLSNSLIATASAIIERHPEIEVHFASFQTLADKISHVSDLALKSQRKLLASSASPPSSSGVGDGGIIYHPLTRAPSILERLALDKRKLEDRAHAPGLRGFDTQLENVQIWSMPWTPEQHLAMYHEIHSLIEVEINPAVIVLDTFMRAGLDAARAANRLHAFISPNLLLDNFVGQQPWGAALWKFPINGSGYKFPLSWDKILPNAYQVLRLVYVLVAHPQLRAMHNFLKANGVENPSNWLGLHRADTPWIAQYVEGACVPADFVPENVTLTGPLFISSAPAKEQDAELVAWMSRAPTVLINLGSTTFYNPPRAEAMVGGIAEVLRAQPELQVLWKYQIPEGLTVEAFAEAHLGHVSQYLENRRLRISTWLTVDPASLLESGLITTSVHHGGANCYWEALGSGVPHVIFPLWADHFTFARAAEYAGVGVWACEETSPHWSAKCVAEAIIKVASGDEASLAMRRKAQHFGDVVAQQEPGRNAAARRIAQLAGSGK